MKHERALTFSLVLLLAACGHTSGEVTQEEDAPAELDELRITSVNTTVGVDAEIVVEFDIAADTTAFALEGDLSDNETMGLLELYAPDGTLVLDCADWMPATAYEMTSACFYAMPNVLDYPIIPGDTLSPGTWTAVYASLGDEGDQATMTLIERGPEADEQTDFYVQVLVADGLPARFQDKSIYDRAIQHWTTLWADQGIIVHARWGTVDIGPRVSDGMDWREGPDAAGADGELTIVFTKLKEPYVLGYVTLVPGPILSDDDGILVLDIPAHAGRDGEFDDDEADTLGETIAHEALHYTGVFHPVDGGGFPDSWDTLDDTLECLDWDTCEAELGTNLMYWNTVFTESGERVPQVDLTAGQRFIAHHWAGTL